MYRGAMDVADVAERRKSNVKGKGCFKNKIRKGGRKETEGNKRKRKYGRLNTD